MGKAAKLEFTPKVFLAKNREKDIEIQQRSWGDLLRHHGALGPCVRGARLRGIRDT
jgi:hypothetical protein